jgi:hypothetical protein
MLMRFARQFAAIVVLTLALAVSGCNIIINGGDTGPHPGITQLQNSVTTIQTQDPRSYALPDSLTGTGDLVVLSNGVTLIVDPAQDLVFAQLSGSTVLGFENQTGVDIYVTYLVDGVHQDIYVFDGETLLLEYPCLGSIELVTEFDIDPSDGSLLNSYNLAASFVNPGDFLCGDAIVLTFQAFTTEVLNEIIVLTQ